MSTMTVIEEFLAQTRIALVGVSRDHRDFSHAVMRALVEHGIDVVPVNERMHPPQMIAGRTAYRSLADVPGELGGVLVMVDAQRSADVVREAIAHGVKRVWLHRGAGRGASSPEAVALAREHGLALVDGECPLMMLPGAGFIHRLHYAFRARRLGAPRKDAWQPRVGRGLATTLFVLQVVIALNALVAGVMLMVEPSGRLLGFTREMIAGSPFASYFVPGLVLASINGLARGIAALGTLRRRAWAGLAALVLGAFLVAWIVVQATWLRSSSWLQPALAIAGGVEVLLGWWWLRIVPPAVAPPTSAGTLP